MGDDWKSDQPGGLNALHCAAMKGSLEAVMLLCDNLGQSLEIDVDRVVPATQLVYLPLLTTNWKSLFSLFYEVQT
jgi:hypothetical protein